MKTKWLFFFAGVVVGFGMAVAINLSADRAEAPRPEYAYPALTMPQNTKMTVVWRQSAQ